MYEKKISKVLEDKKMDNLQRIVYTSEGSVIGTEDLLSKLLEKHFIDEDSLREKWGIGRKSIISFLKEGGIIDYAGLTGWFYVPGLTTPETPSNGMPMLGLVIKSRDSQEINLENLTGEKYVLSFLGHFDAPGSIQRHEVDECVVLDGLRGREIIIYNAVHGNHKFYLGISPTE